MPRPTGSSKLAKQVGARLRELRTESGRTLEKTAWAADVSKPYLSQIEAGLRLPSLAVLKVLAKELGVELADVVALDLAQPRLALLEATRLGEWKKAAKILRDLKAADDS